MIILGLTGGIATGKSTVSKFFIDQGIPVIDTDLIARNLLNKGTESYLEVVRIFSNEILLTNNEIILNEILHPKVRTIVDEEIKRYKALGSKVIVIDVPLLFETNYQEIVDKTIVVFATPEEQLSRLMSRDIIKEEYAQMKINAQMSIFEKVDIADYVIDNSFSILRTKKDFLKILKDLEVLL